MVKTQAKQVFSWPGRAAAVGAVLTLLLFLLPLFFLAGEGEEPAPMATLPVLTPTPAVRDGETTLRLLLADGTVETLTMADYLWGVVAAEMPASFHPEALKAQAVAARTYCAHQSLLAGDKHPGAEVCADPGCCQAYLTRDQALAAWGAEGQRYADKITAAVADTDGLLCLYEGQPIDALFFSSSAGKTSTAAQVWGTDVPYLTSVDSPEGEEVPGWRTEVTFTPWEFRTRLLDARPEAQLSDDPGAWVRDLVTDPSGAVERVTVGGVELTGVQARSIFGLRSAHFTAAATAEAVTFQVTGYGHGVGMSQYGANALAGEGKDFREILCWYYTGITVDTLEQ